MYTYIGIQVIRYFEIQPKYKIFYVGVSMLQEEHFQVEASGAKINKSKMHERQVHVGSMGTMESGNLFPGNGT